VDTGWTLEDTSKFPKKWALEPSGFEGAGKY